MPARHCARSALLSARSALLSVCSALEKTKKKGRGPERFFQVEAEVEGRPGLTLLRGIDRKKKGENDGEGVLGHGHASKAAPRSPGTKAKPIDFNDRRMSLEALDLPTEREGVRLAGRNGRAGGGERRPAAGLEALRPGFLAPQGLLQDRHACGLTRENPPKKGGKRRKGNAPARRSPSSGPPAKRVCGFRPTPKKKRVAPSPVRGPAPVPPPRRHGSPRR